MRTLSRESEDEGILASINVIPFVDIVLVLLVIFMLTSAAIMRAQLKVELPKAATAGSVVESTINLVYTKKGDLLFNGEKVSFADAARAIRREAILHPKTQAVISADTGVEYGRVVDLIDLVKHNGVNTFALDVERRQSSSPSSPP